MSSISQLLDAVAAFDLGPTSSPRSEPLDDAEWRPFFALVSSQRITGLLLAAAEHGVVVLTDAQRSMAEAAQADAMAAALRLERSLLAAADALAAAEVPMRVLKGPAVAHLDYPDPALRSFGDIDLLVPGHRFDDAVAVLLDAGGRRPYAELRPGFDRRFGKGAMIIGADGMEIDLHRTFVAGPFGMTIDFDALFASERGFVVGATRLSALDDTHRFLHACYHAAIGRGTPRVVPLRDVAQMALSADLDGDAVFGAARAWRGEVVVARAVATAWDRFRLGHLTPLSVWAARYEPDPSEQRMLAGYTGAGWSFGAQALAALRIIPGVRAKAAYAYALALPGGDALRTRRASRLTRWRRGARLAARELRPR